MCQHDLESPRPAAFFIHVAYSCLSATGVRDIAGHFPDAYCPPGKHILCSPDSTKNEAGEDFDYQVASGSPDL